MRQVIMVALALSWGCAPAFADEQLVPLVENGNWIAMEHRPSMTDPPDVCVAANPSSGLGIRSDGTTVQVRYSDTSWSLPDGVKGSIGIAVDGATYSFDIDDNTDTMVNAEIDTDKVQSMLDEMGKAGSMAITVGKAKPVTISLAGSMKVLNAFRTCAGIGGGSAGGGGNPFQ
jgi:hypothetical protein